MMHKTLLLLTIATSVLALPHTRNSNNNNPTPPTSPLPPNSTWVFGGCIPSSVNSNQQCAQAAKYWTGDLTVGNDGCPPYTDTIPIWCGSYIDFYHGYYPSRYDENVLENNAIWNYTGCVSSSIPPAKACGNNQYPFMYGRTPQGSHSCGNFDEYPLWCANGQFDDWFN